MPKKLAFQELLKPIQKMGYNWGDEVEKMENEKCSKLFFVGRDVEVGK